MPSLKDLYQRLTQPDRRRRGDLPFSEDIATANELLFDPFAADKRQELLNLWMQRRQPCLFGSIGAGFGALHYCILTENDILGGSDSDIEEKIREELLIWKRRSLNPSRYSSAPAHGFVLIAASPRLAEASPEDSSLREFATRLRDVWGCRETQESSGTVHWESLYLAGC